MTQRHLDIEALGRVSRVTGIVSLLGIAAVMGALVYSSLALYRVNERVATAKKDLNDAKRHLNDAKRDLDDALRKADAAKGELRKLEAACARQQLALDQVGLQLATQRIEAAQRTVTAQLSAPATALGQRVQARVYFQVRTPQQARDIQPAMMALKRQGYSVPGPEVLPAKGPSRTEVRYFHKGEQDEAAEIRLLLGSNGVSDPQLCYVPGYERSALIRPRHYEVWLGSAAVEVPSRSR